MPGRTIALALVSTLLASPATAAFDTFPEHELLVTNTSLISYTQKGGLYELVITAELENLDAATFDWVTAEIGEGLPRMVQSSGWLEFDEIEPYAVAAPVKGTVTLQVPRAMLRRTLDALANGAIAWELDGIERTVYYDGIYPMDSDTRLEYNDEFSGGGTAIFAAWTDLLTALQPGDIIIFIDGDEDDPLSQPKAPWEVLDITSDDDWVYLDYTTAAEAELEDLIVSGTVSATMNNGGDGMHQSVFSNNNTTESCFVNEDKEMECSFAGIYLANNDIELATGVELDGGVNMKTVNTAFHVRMREGVMDEVAVDLELGYDSAMALFGAVPKLTPEFETTLIEIHIPVVDTTMAGVPLEVGLGVSLYLGAEADFDAAAALGLHHRGTVGVTFEADLSGEDIGYSSTPFIDVEPLLTSPPTLADDAVGSFRAWMAAEATVELYGGLIGGPSASLGAFTEFSVDPSQDPWWQFEAGGEVEGTLQLELLGFGVIAQTYGLETETVRTDGATVAAFSGIGDLASGEQVRWAENYHYGGTYGDYPVDLAVLDDEDLIFATWNPAVVARVDRTGQLEWDTYLTWPSLAGLVAYDGGVLALGESGRALWIGELDLDTGDLVQQHQYGTSYVFDCTGVHVIDDGPTPSFLVKGTMLTEDSWFRAWLAYVTYNPAAKKDPLTIHWSRIYDSQSTYGPYPDDFRALVWDDGDIYVGGVTTAGQPAGTISYNALMAKLDSSGDQIWARAVRDGGDSVNAMALADDGTLLTVGSYPMIVTQVPYFHSFWFSMWDAKSGSYLTSNGLSEDLWWEAFPNTGAYPSYTTPGASIYDAGSAIIPLADGGYAATGYSGLGSQKGWIMSLDPRLEVRWLSTIEGGNANLPVILRDTGSGLAVLSQTTSPAVHGYGGNGMDTMLLSVPYDGILAFEDATGMNSRYTKPDMVPPPSNETIVPLEYIITDHALTHEAATVGAQPAGISNWTLDPW